MRIQSNGSGGRERWPAPTILLLSFLLGGPSQAATPQNIVFTSSQAPTLTATAAHPAASGLGSNRFEFRMRGFTPTPGRRDLFSPTNNVILRAEGSQLCGLDFVDTVAVSPSVCVDLSEHEGDDLTIHVQRDIVGKTWSIMAYETNGWTVLSSQSVAIESVGTQPWLYANRPLPFFQNVAVSLAWFKWFSSAASTSKMTETAPADLLDLRFDGTTTDQGATPLTWSGAGGTYALTTNFPPACLPGPQQIARTGSLTLDGSGSFGLNGSDAVTYSWQALSGPNTPGWSSTAAEKPTLRGTIFGSYTVQLTVTDSDGLSTSCSTKHGSVATDAKGVVQTGNVYADYLLGPMTISGGTTPWPWFDQVQRQAADFFGGKQGGDFSPTWRTASPHGTISVPVNTDVYGKNSQPVIGAGTTFSSDFFSGTCSGGGVPNGNVIVLWYPSSIGGTGYRFMNPVSCSDDTHMILQANYYFGTGPVVNSPYAIMTGPQLATWVNGSNNANYYDNVLAFYALYYRTGLDEYLTYARQLADLWYEQPGSDRGQACSAIFDASGWWCGPPRVQALQGLMLRAEDGRPEIWTGLLTNGVLDHFLHYAPLNSPLIDMREVAATHAMTCTAAFFLKHNGRDAAHLATYMNACNADVSQLWTSQVTTSDSIIGAGAWLNTILNYSPVIANATAGSSVVTLTTPITCPAALAGYRLWVANPIPAPLTYDQGDSKTFAITACTPNSLTIDRPYNGTHAGPARQITMNFFGGQYTQPFMVGYVSNMLSLAQKTLDEGGYAASAATARRLVVGAALWLKTYGWRPATRGYFYTRGGLLNDVACEPDPEIVNNPFVGGEEGYLCTHTYQDHETWTVQSSRFLMGETLRSLSQAYQFASPADQATLLDFGDQVSGAMWGKPGDLNGDANYLKNYYPIEGAGKAKDFGFAFGWGGGSQWTAVTAGITRTPSPTTPPPSGPTLPPDLSLPSVVAINQSLRLRYGSLAVSRVGWTFEPSGVTSVASAADRRAPSASAGMAGYTTTASESFIPQGHGLIPGTYQVTVQLLDSSGAVLIQATQAITLVAADLAGVKVYPNPWRSDRHAAHPGITFEGLTLGTTVKIFTIAGHRLTALHTDGPKIVWGLTNDTGDKVASGIYIYLITDAQGDRVSGKVAVIK
jgi:hypothetical protein